METGCGLDWIGLDWICIVWDWIGLNWIALDWIGLDSDLDLDWIWIGTGFELACIGLEWIGGCEWYESSMTFAVKPST